MFVCLHTYELTNTVGKMEDSTRENYFLPSMIKGVFTEKDFQAAVLLYAMTTTRYFKNSSMKCNFFQIK